MVLTSEIIETIDMLMKDVSDIEVIGLYQDKDHAIELSHKDGVFFVRLDGANLYAGEDGSDATSMFYEQIAQIHDDADRGTDPSFASLREILQARNEHVREMLAAIGHERLAASLDGIELAKEFNFKNFQKLIKQNMTALDVLKFANYRPSEKENEECHTCIFFAAGGFCTKLDLPVKEEMMCDWFKPLPMAEKNEEWSHVSHQEWEEPEHEEEHEHNIEGVQKDVSKDLIYTSEDNLESPANKLSDARKPNLVMREFVPYGAEDGYQILAQNDDRDGIEVQLVKSRGEWNVFTKQRDYSDLGDPFQSVGEPYQPKKVKLREDDDKEGVDKLREVRGQDGGEVEKIAPLLGAIGGAVAGAAGKAVGGIARGVADMGGDAAQELSETDENIEKDTMISERLPGTGTRSSEITSRELGATPALTQAISSAGENNQSGVPASNIPSDMRAHNSNLSDLFAAQEDESRVGQTKVDRKVQQQQEQFKNLDYSEIDEGRVEKGLSNEGGLGIDDPEALNDGTGASSQHYRRIKEDEENSKSSLAMKAYANDPQEVQKPIDPDEDGREALSSAETGTGTQAFSSGAVIDMPDEALNSKASGGAGGEGVEGGGDGSSTMIPPPDASDRDLESDYESDLTPKHRDFRHIPSVNRNTSVVKEGGGDGGGGGGGDGGGGFSGGTAMSTGGGGGDSTHTDTHGGRTGKERKYNSRLELKDSMDAGTFEGVSTTPLPYPQDDDTRPPRTVERHKPGDSEEEEDKAQDDLHEIPMHQQPIGEGYASSYVIAEDEEKYSPTAITEKPEHELVRRKFIDEDNRLRSVNDNAAEQYTNLSAVSQDLTAHFLHKGDTPESLGEDDLFKVLTPDSIKKMDTGRTLVVAGWGNYFMVDREGHRIGLEGMRRAMTEFLNRKEFANMNIFHSGIQVGQILRRFVDDHGKEWKTEVLPQGLFVVAAFRTDLEVSRKAMAEVLKGSMRGFSIAGNAKSKEIKCDHGKCWTEVNDLEIYEVTLCVAPMNPKSYITDIVQKPDPMICPECYDTNQLEFDSSLRTR